jgi:S-ribosylhomocysteine lyase LuxS involved in autoinducer biosynthesis
MTTRKQKKSVLTSEDKLELVAAINKSMEICNDTLECGSAWCHEIHDARDKMRNIAQKLGFKQDNWWGEFKV